MTRPNPLGHTLIIANPAAQSGYGEVIAGRLQRFLRMYFHDLGTFELVRTERPRHAVELAAGAQGYDTVLALGGDGVIHEVANGLMRIGRDGRPTLGLLPVGSGNDYARTLGIGDWRGEHFDRLLTCERVRMDVGRVRGRRVPEGGGGVDGSCEDGSDPEAACGAGIPEVPCPGNPALGETDAGSCDTADQPAAEFTEYFVQTCSFGLDAAIAHGTAALRKRTGLRGGLLYGASGLEQFGLRFRRFPARVRLDERDLGRMRTLLLAMQIGPTYGSGFSVCPEADPTDGLLDICYAKGAVPRAVALPAFLSAKGGNHTRLPFIHMERARRVELEFEHPDVPIQTDGERIRAVRMAVECLPRELAVWRPVW